MTTWRRRIEIFSNLAVILCCILVAGMLVRNYFLSKTREEAKPSLSRPTSLVGKNISLANVDWEKNQQTLLLVLRRGCRFCDESALFYQRLAKELSSQSRTHLMAVMPQSVEDDKQYLSEKMIDVSDVRQGSLSSIGVRGTPTLLLLDSTGTVLEEWAGKLPATQEDAVIGRLKQ